MKKYLYDYIKKIDSVLEEERIDKKIVEEHLIKITFFQHERLIHLLVTLAYALLALISFAISTFSPMFVFIGIILVLFLIPYVMHYFHLENGVQDLYKHYDELRRKSI